MLTCSAGIPHHLIDICDPSEEFSAGDFYDCARKITNEVLEVRISEAFLAETSLR